MLRPETAGSTEVALDLEPLPRDMLPDLGQTISTGFIQHMSSWEFGDRQCHADHVGRSARRTQWSCTTAAKVDGANIWHTFKCHLPNDFTSLVLQSCVRRRRHFPVFPVPLVVNNGHGRPGGATMFFNLYLYKTLWTFQNMSLRPSYGMVAVRHEDDRHRFSVWDCPLWVYCAGEGRS